MHRRARDARADQARTVAVDAPAVARRADTGRAGHVPEGEGRGRGSGIRDRGSGIGDRGSGRIVTQRVVVIAPNWLGDAVMALPAFADIRRHFPSAHIAVAARPSVAPIYTMVSGVDDVITLPGGGGLRAWTGWRK